MLAVLSPAKALDFTPPGRPLPDSTRPALMKDAQSLMRTARRLSQRRIRELMGLSAELAKLNYDRYRAFELPFDEGNALGAALAFDGEVYRGLSARTLSAEDLAWAQDRIAILSGMFGVLRPLDLIQPYRLEMGTRLPTRRGDSLYAFWGDRITEQIGARLEGHADRTLVNLASGEYFKAVRPKKLPGAVVTCVFEDWKDAARTPNVISFMAKRARGLMARYVVTERVDRPEGLRDFGLERYRLVPERSTPDRLVFGRRFVPAGA